MIITTINNQKKNKNIRAILILKKYLYRNYAMLDILKIDWYIEPPIDFEHKQYVLLNYLQKVDNSFIEKKLSPHLLNLEKIRNELNNFKFIYKDVKFNLEKHKYIYFENNSKIKGLENHLIYEIVEIIDFFYTTNRNQD
jgi:hypothetical protein